MMIFSLIFLTSAILCSGLKWNPSEPLSIRLSCKNLKNPRILSNPDPFIEVSFKGQNYYHPALLGKTEYLSGQLNPGFQEQIDLPPIKDDGIIYFNIFDHKTNQEKKHLGGHQVQYSRLTAIMAQYNYYYFVVDGKTSCLATAMPNIDPKSYNTYLLEVSAYELKKKFLSKPKSYIYVRLPIPNVQEPYLWPVIAKLNHAEGKSPRYRDARLDFPIDFLKNTEPNENGKLFFQVFSFETKGSDEVLGQFYLSIREILGHQRLISLNPAYPGAITEKNTVTVQLKGPFTPNYDPRQNVVQNTRPVKKSDYMDDVSNPLNPNSIFNPANPANPVTHFEQSSFNFF